MSILQEILKWSQGLPAWQQDAIARLYAKSDLSPQDFDDMYALLKSEHGIPDPGNRKSAKLTDGQVATPQAQDQQVQIVAIKNLRNVNALAENQRLPINASGLSVIYGENGAGKSGYSRVFKKACRARDQREPIHPNAHRDPSKVGLAQATFELIVDGQPLDVEWLSGKEAPEQLSSIAIFDSHCARAYVDNQGDFAYVPYGLDILEGLVNACGKLRAMAIKEQSDNTPKVEIFSTLSKTQTSVGKMLASLSATTNPEDVENLAKWTAINQERLDTISKTLAETDPKAKSADFKKFGCAPFRTIHPYRHVHRHGQRRQSYRTQIPHRKIDNCETGRQLGEPKLQGNSWSSPRYWGRGVEGAFRCGTRICRRVAPRKGVPPIGSRIRMSATDYKKIEAAMTKCSKFAAHDPALGAHLQTPPPETLSADIEGAGSMARIGGKAERCNSR